MYKRQRIGGDVGSSWDGEFGPQNMMRCLTGNNYTNHRYYQTDPDACLLYTSIERIRKKDPDVRTRFIIISGYDDFAYMKKAIQLGVINYIKKPILQQEFTDMLRDVCRQLDEEREKEEKKEENIYSWTDFLQLRKWKDIDGTYFLVRGKEIGKEAGNCLGELEAMGGGKSWKVIRFYGAPDILLLVWEGKNCTGREIEAAAGKKC